MAKVALLIAVLGVTGYLLNQVRRPSRWIGRLFLKDMNRRHSALTDWGLGHARLGPQRAILDVGCGGGRTLAKLAALAPDARLVGVDYADGSVAEARSHNAALIDAGRLEVIRASVAALPGPAAQFDLVTAVESHYYWPDLARCFAEVRRVLRPGGQFVLIAECYAGGRFGWLIGLAMKPLRATVLSVEGHRAVLAEAGFDPIDVQTDARRGWICAVARAPG
jgi:SAM-dependent methyltransferase